MARQRERTQIAFICKEKLRDFNSIEPMSSSLQLLWKYLDIVQLCTTLYCMGVVMDTSVVINRQSMHYKS